MKSYLDKRSDNRRQSIASAVAQLQRHGMPLFQLVDNRSEAKAQRKQQQLINHSSQLQHAAQMQLMAKPFATRQTAIQRIENKTGLPNQLKAGIENISGYSMDDVKVHYNSNKPALLQAHAYAQGTSIHLARGQEKHLPHEAWHVVQQKQGRVKPTAQLKEAVNINDDAGLEREADIMGKQAATSRLLYNTAPIQRAANATIVQLAPMIVARNLAGKTGAVLHENPRYGSKELARVPNDNHVEAVRQVGDFWECTYRGITGYIRGRYLITPTPEVLALRKDAHLLKLRGLHEENKVRKMAGAIGHTTRTGAAIAADRATREGGSLTRDGDSLKMYLGHPNYASEFLGLPHQGFAAPVRSPVDEEHRTRWQAQIVGGTFQSVVTGAEINGRELMFVIGEDGQLYIHYKLSGVYQHSSFFAGGSVRTAGIITLSAGKLLEYFPSSGHYQPDQRAMEYALNYFQRHGVNITRFHYPNHPDWQAWYDGYLGRDAHGAAAGQSAVT